MKDCSWIRPLALAGVAVFTLGHSHAQFANQVHGYDAGTGAANRFTDPTSALGEPSRVTPGQFGGPVDPFNPPYLNSQLVSVGAGGALTVGFSTPLSNDPAHPYGVDFQIFSGAGFMITNAVDSEFNYIGTPATDGSLFGSQTGPTRVSVSEDGINFFALNPALAPEVEALFPTNGQGDFNQPVNPELDFSEFAGLTLEGIRAKYAGSAGGAGFDLAWAQDSQGLPVVLTTVSFVRIEVLSGRLEVDAFSSVSAVPEPDTWALAALSLVVWAMAVRGRQSRPGTTVHSV